MNGQGLGSSRVSGEIVDRLLNRISVAQPGHRGQQQVCIEECWIIEVSLASMIEGEMAQVRIVSVDGNDYSVRQFAYQVLGEEAFSGTRRTGDADQMRPLLHATVAAIFGSTARNNSRNVPFTRRPVSSTSS